MLNTKYERYTLSGFTEEDFLRFSYEKLIGPGARPFLAQGGHHLIKLVKGPLGEATYPI